MNPFHFLDRLKALKKTSSGLIGSFNIKKIEIYWRVFYFYKTFLLFCFISHLETSHFSYRGSVIDKPSLQSNEAQ